MNWNHVLNWRLLTGSHDFPGPDGGTCVSEAAIIAAGFEYRKIVTTMDCPPCFSPVLAGYAITLNDMIVDDDLRQELLAPFVTRLAGTADAPEIEQSRFEHIFFGLIRTVLPIALHGQHEDLVALCQAAKNYRDVQAAARAISNATTDRVADVARALASATDPDWPDWQHRRQHQHQIIHLALSLAHHLAPLRQSHHGVFFDAVHRAEAALLDGAAKIGRQSPRLDDADVAARMVKATATAAADAEIALLLS